jgi:hypothetical protein
LSTFFQAASGFALHQTFCLLGDTACEARMLPLASANPDWQFATARKMNTSTAAGQRPPR